MKTSNEELFKNISRLYKNIFNLMVAFQQATNTNQSEITVQLINDDNSVQTVTVQSFQNMMLEIARIDSNFNSLLNENNISYIVQSDGSIAQTTKTTFMNAEYISSINVGDVNSTILDYTSQLKNMVFPNVKIPVDVDVKIKSDVRAKIYTVYGGFSDIPDDIEMISLDYLINSGTVQADFDETVLRPEKERVRYFGKFTVTNAVTVGNTVTATLANIQYSSLTNVGPTINLVAGDVVVTKSGSAKFRIEEINNFTKTITAVRIEGTGNVTSGIDSLYFNEVMSVDDNNTIGIPVQPNTQIVVFLQPENLKVIGYPSKGIKIDTSTYNVIYEGNTYTLDEFFNTYVTNVSDYLTSLIKETTIPASLGVMPQPSTLNGANFKVIQINKHLTDSKTTQELEDLNRKKQKIKNDIDYKQKEIDLTQGEVNTLKFNSLSEKQYRINKIQNLRQEINELQTQLLTVSRDLDNNAIQYGLKATSPKYRIIGMWDLHRALMSPATKPQRVIKYEVQYRYLAKNVDTVDSTAYKMIDADGREVNVVISPWNVLETRTLNKVFNVDGSYSWETPVLDSVDDININQVNIPINEGESVEIRVRPISEAGYPVAPLKGDWSNILRVDFPNSLVEGSISSIVSKNEADLKKAEFNNILQNAGIMTHMQNQIQEAEKLFFHKADDIASGFYTAEQKNIPLSVYLQMLTNDIKVLQNADSQEQLSIQLLDFNNEPYNVVNNATMEINAGNYSDNINLLDNTKWGSIIRKQAYIKIKNNNSVPVELKTLVPGPIFNSNVAPKYYNVPARTNDSLLQKSKQVVYFRNLDITGQDEDTFRLVKSRNGVTQTYPNEIYIDGSATETDKNIVYMDVDGTVKTCKLLGNAGTDFIAMTKGHPAFNIDNLDAMASEFERLKLYSSSLKADFYQDEPYLNGDELLSGLGFLDQDFYSVGENSCGAFLYPVISNPASIQVVGSNTISTLIIPSGSELIIPIMYEFRMIDRIGKINGVNDLTINDTLVYKKKLGVDMLINNNIFTFDILVTSKLNSTLTPISTLNVTSVVAGFNNESPEVLS